MFFSRKKNASDYESLVMPHLEKLYRFAYRLTGHQEDAEDLIQDLVLKLQPRYEQLLKIERLDIWMSRVLYRMFVDSKRRYQRSPVRILSDLGVEFHQEDFLDAQQADEHNPEQFTAQDRFRNQLHFALNCLNEDYRLAITLYEIEGYTLEEICNMLDVPMGTLKSRLHRGRIQLRQLLEQENMELTVNQPSKEEAL